jgi:hypothetical protein
MAHEATIGLIRRVLELGINITEVSALSPRDIGKVRLLIVDGSLDLCRYSRPTIELSVKTLSDVPWHRYNCGQKG